MIADDYFGHTLFKRTETVFQDPKVQYNLEGRPAQEAARQEAGDAKSFIGCRAILVRPCSPMASTPGKVSALVCECRRAKRRHRAGQSLSPICYQSVGVISDHLPQASLMKSGSVKERYMNVSQSLFTLA